MRLREPLILAVGFLLAIACARTNHFVSQQGYKPIVIFEDVNFQYKPIDYPEWVYEGPRATRIDMKFTVHNSKTYVGRVDVRLEWAFEGRPPVAWELVENGRSIGPLNKETPNEYTLRALEKGRRYTFFLVWELPPFHWRNKPGVEEKTDNTALKKITIDLTEVP